MAALSDPRNRGRNAQPAPRRRSSEITKKEGAQLVLLTQGAPFTCLPPSSFRGRRSHQGRRPPRGMRARRARPEPHRTPARSLRRSSARVGGIASKADRSSLPTSPSCRLPGTSPTVCAIDNPRRFAAGRISADVRVRGYAVQQQRARPAGVRRRRVRAWPRMRAQPAGRLEQPGRAQQCERGPGRSAPLTSGAMPRATPSVRVTTIRSCASS